MGLIVGLLVGLAVALGVALYVTKTPVPLMNKGQQKHARAGRGRESNATRPGIRTPRWPASSRRGRQRRRRRQPASDTAMVPRMPRRSCRHAATDNAKVAPSPAHVETPKSTRDAAAHPERPGQRRCQPRCGTKVRPPVPIRSSISCKWAPTPNRKTPRQQRAKLALMRRCAPASPSANRTAARSTEFALGPFDKKDEADAQTDRAKAIDPRLVNWCGSSVPSTEVENLRASRGELPGLHDGSVCRTNWKNLFNETS